MEKTNQLRKGFTLIELLIVVSIIGILSVALIPNLSGAPARARDAARKAMLSEVAAAVETFNIDYGRYPTGSGCIVTGSTNADIADVVTTYLKGMPPLQDNVGLSIDDGATSPTPGTVDCPTSVKYTQLSNGYVIFTGLESGRGGDYNLYTLQTYNSSTDAATAASTVASGTGNAHALVR